MACLAPPAGHDVLGLRPPTVKVLGIADDGLFQGRNAIRRCVPHLSRRQERARREDRVDGRFALGFAAAQVDDGVALRTQNCGHFVELESCRFANGFGDQGEAHGCHVPSTAAFRDGTRIISNDCENIHLQFAARIAGDVLWRWRPLWRRRPARECGRDGRTPHPVSFRPSEVTPTPVISTERSVPPYPVISTERRMSERRNLLQGKSSRSRGSSTPDLQSTLPGRSHLHHCWPVSVCRRKFSCVQQY